MSRGLLSTLVAEGSFGLLDWHLDRDGESAWVEVGVWFADIAGLDAVLRELGWARIPQWEHPWEETEGGLRIWLYDLHDLDDEVVECL